MAGVLRDLVSKTLKANFVQLFVFCGVDLESSSFFNSILVLLESSSFFISTPVLPNSEAESVSAIF